MAAGSRSGSDAGQAEKLHRIAEELHRIAEERFLAGDVAGSLRVAREAEARCGSRQGFHALAAYEAHAAAAVRNWYGVLGVGSRGSVTHEDIKRRYRRLCLVVHPDKNRSAAADGAFKLLQEAWTVLSARHPPPLKPRTAPSQSPREPSTTTGARRPGSPASTAEKPSNHSPPPPAASDTFCSRKPRRGAPPPRTFRSVYCAHCDREFYAADDDDGKQKEYCVLCGEQLSDPRRPTAAGSETLRRRRRENGSFSCPGQCPRCGERDAYKPCMVSVLMWQLRCVSCHHQGPKSSRSGLY